MLFVEFKYTIPDSNGKMQSSGTLHTCKSESGMSSIGTRRHSQWSAVARRAGKFPGERLPNDKIFITTTRKEEFDYSHQIP